MVKSFALAARLLRGGGRHGLLGTVLTLAAVTVSTALLLAAIAANSAFAARTERTAWQTPASVSESEATAIQFSRNEYFGDRAITVIRLAALKPGAPVPPGLDAFPAPGQFYASPALRDALSSGDLAARFPPLTGDIPEAELAGPDQLVAVIGMDPGAVSMKAQNMEQTPTWINGFGDGESVEALIYDILLKIATALVAAPLLIFGAAAARLTVARRDTRLAALRLVGATPAQVVAMTAAEAVLTAAVGAVLGALIYLMGFAGLAQIPMQGSNWFTGDLWVGVPWLLGVLIAVPLMTGASAVIGLRQVVVSPLGVARRQTPPGLRFVRLLAVVAALIAASLMTAQSSTTVIMVVLAMVFLALNLAGPFIVSVIGRISAAFARTPARLLAARRLVDDPRSAWRTVAGVALTGFIAGFIGLLSPSAIEADTGRTQVAVESSIVTTESADAALTAAGLTARVDSADPGVVRVLATPDEVEKVKTALATIDPGAPLTADSDSVVQGTIMLGDIQVGVRIVLIVSFLVAIASAGIAGASSVLDRRRTYSLLRLAGTPLKVLDRARALETRLPLIVMGGGSIIAGVICGLPFAVAGMFSVAGMVTLGICVVIGFLGVAAASGLSRPLLRSVTVVGVAPQE
ncbi:hypothetical protein Afil01_06430 [Actinorhabdospora filicis]|uniref:FtsX-like permease family protein n=1 Tax=Actinorhabdospora filicis TaxID=1785913 RepID=A0A9W6SJL6_9ACTN|nr:hypothetical protein [Actinorhabdospora filicis]GLZ75836.1 hypothetical protein Afil01_06430 [Actinorhabdospora filicis]